MAIHGFLHRERQINESRACCYSSAQVGRGGFAVSCRNKLVHRVKFIQILSSQHQCVLLFTF